MMAALVLLFAASCTNPGPDPDPDPDPEEPVLEVYPETSEGAAIKVTGIDYRKIVWEVEPGVDCPSYRVEVFPYVRLLNDLFESRKTSPGMTEDECIKLKMFDQTGSGAGAFEGAREYDTDMTIFQGFKFPDFEYLIAVYGCLNEDGTSPGELTKIKVRTKAYDQLVGNPMVKQSYLANYRRTQIFYEPNEDCKYYCYMDVPKKDADDIINEFGEDFLRELILCFTMSPSSGPTDHVLDWGANADPENIVTSIVTAMDGNYMRAPKVGTLEYHVQPKPEERDPAEYTITFTRASSYVIQFDFVINPENTMYGFYAMNGAGYGEVGTPTAEDLDYAGWGVTKNDPHQWQFTSPDSDYSVYATARNHYYDLLPMETWPLGKTKAIGNEITGTAKDEMMQINVKEVTKTTIKMEFVADTEAVASWFRMAVEDSDEYGGALNLNDPNSKNKLLSFMRSEADIDGNDGSEDIRFHAWTGMEPGTLYHQYILAENWDGDWALYHNQMNTDMNVGGLNPEVVITATASDGVFTATFTPNADTNKLMYMVHDDYLTGSGYSDTQMYNAWLELCAEYGLSNLGSVATINRNYVEDSERMVALAIPYGKDNVRGALKVLTFNPFTGEIKEFEPGGSGIVQNIK